jgi:WD40 repeat protein
VTSVALATTPDGQLVAATGSQDQTVRLWDVSAGIPLGKPLTGHNDSVMSVAVTTAPDGRLILVAASGKGWTAFELLAR